ncbi:hypothetical protein HQ545_03035 [Candidatus Woesearchaeota archaeon]|nr:hypothetical protein [Candidatus Woesearchaeota archaeon]
MKKVITLCISAVLILALASMVFAVDRSSSASDAAVTVINESAWTSSQAGNDAAKAGNVTEMDLSSSTSTLKWAGYYGEVSGDLRLGNSDGDIMYNFGAIDDDQVQAVFASTDTSFDFTGLVVGTAAAVDTAWGFTAGDSDSAASTLADDTPTVVTVASVPSANLSATSGTYQSGVFTDGSSSVYGDFAFGGSTSIDGTAFDGSTSIDYALIVPVNSTELTQTYYFFLDIE